MSGCACGHAPRPPRFVGERVQVRCGLVERAVGTVIAEDEIGITIETSDTERLYPWSGITSIRRARA